MTEHAGEDESDNTIANIPRNEDNTADEEQGGGENGTDAAQLSAKHDGWWSYILTPASILFNSVVYVPFLFAVLLTSMYRHDAVDTSKWRQELSAGNYVLHKFPPPQYYSFLLCYISFRLFQCDYQISLHLKIFSNFKIYVSPHCNIKDLG
jgi:hypothetical protein